jgi:hypothetical protein
LRTEVSIFASQGERPDRSVDQHLHGRFLRRSAL